MDIGIIGPLEVLVGATNIQLGSKVQRKLLSFLATSAPLPMSVDRIADALWGENQPSSPAGSIGFHVSKTRSALGEARTALGTAPGSGYYLDLDACRIDTHRFEALLAEARLITGRDPNQAERLLAQAAALLRGPILGEFEYEDWARPEIGRHEELALELQELSAETQLELGKHRAAVAELRALVAQHPYREKLRYLLMLALYRSGDQTEALSAYRDAAIALGEGFGLDPYPELKRLELRILEQAPDLANPLPPPQVSWRVPAETTSFVGRREESLELLSRLDEFRLVVVTGAPGIGKTRLALATAEQIRDQQRPVTWVSHEPADGSVATSICRDLAMRSSPAEDLVAAIATELVGLELVLVVDSTQLGESDWAQIEKLLATVGGLRVLATSRIAPSSPIGALYPLGPMTESDALALAIVRMKMVGITAPNEDSAATLALSTGLIPGSIVAGAASALHAGNLGDITDPTNAAAVWATENLDSSAVRAWSTLGAFAGAIPVEDAIRLAGETPTQAQDHLRRLVQVGVLERSGDSYKLREPYRRANPPQTQDRDRHAAWIERKVIRGGNTMSPSLPDVESAIAHLAATDSIRAAELATAMGRHWWSQGRPDRALHWYRRLIRPDLPAATIEAASSVATAAALAMGDVGEAKAFAELQATSASALPQPAGAHVLMSSAAISWETGEAGKAAEQYEQAWEQFDRIGHPDAATALSSRISVLAWVGESSDAIRLIRHLAGALDRPDLAGIVEVDLQLVAGAIDAARETIGETLRIGAPQGAIQVVRRLLRRRALAESVLGDDATALATTQRWFHLTPHLVDPTAECEIRAVEVRANLNLGRQRQARRCFGSIARLAPLVSQPVALREALLARAAIDQPSATDISATIRSLERRCQLAPIPWGLGDPPADGHVQDPVTLLTIP